MHLFHIGNKNQVPMIPLLNKELNRLFAFCKTKLSTAVEFDVTNQQHAFFQ